MADTKVYLSARQFCWYRKNKNDGCNYDYTDCYAFTQEWFTNARFIRPEFEFVSQEKRDEIYGKSHIVYHCLGFEFIEMNDKQKEVLDKILSDTEEFFEEVNKGKIKPSKLFSFNIGGMAIVYDGELGDSVLAINDSEFLTPMKNLLINLISQCSSQESDKIELYFNPKNEIVYLAWNWNDGDRKGVIWIGGIKPCYYKSDFTSDVKNCFDEELKIFSDKKYYELSKKD